MLNWFQITFMNNLFTFIHTELYWKMTALTGWAQNNTGRTNNTSGCLCDCLGNPFHGASVHNTRMQGAQKEIESPLMLSITPAISLLVKTNQSVYHKKVHCDNEQSRPYLWCRVRRYNNALWLQSFSVCSGAALSHTAVYHKQDAFMSRLVNVLSHLHFCFLVSWFCRSNK